MSNPDFWRRFPKQTLIGDGVQDGLIVAAHPHNQCPVCHPKDKPETIDAELEVLVSCMRTSAQDTLINLHKAGYHIVKA